MVLVLSQTSCCQLLMSLQARLLVFMLFLLRMASKCIFQLFWFTLIPTAPSASLIGMSFLLKPPASALVIVYNAHLLHLYDGVFFNQFCTIWVQINIVNKHSSSARFPISGFAPLSRMEYLLVSCSFTGVTRCYFSVVNLPSSSL